MNQSSNNSVANYVQQVGDIISADGTAIARADPVYTIHTTTSDKFEFNANETDLICTTTDGTAPYLTFDKYPNYNITIGTGTVNIETSHVDYLTFVLPRDDKMPISVFVGGRMVTLGLLGTNVECAYSVDELVISPGVICMSYAGRVTMSIEYKDEIYHYNIEGLPVGSSSSKTIDAILVSVIKK